jgi:hypothetical protein
MTEGNQACSEYKCNQINYPISINETRLLSSAPLTRGRLKRFRLPKERRGLSSSTLQRFVESGHDLKSFRVTYIPYRVTYIPYRVIYIPCRVIYIPCRVTYISGSYTNLTHITRIFDSNKQLTDF